MKTLTKLALAITILTSAVAAQADWVSGYFRSNGTYVAPYYRSNYGSLGGSLSSTYAAPAYRSAYGSLGLSSSSGYVYRNPYAAYPSVSVNGYYRSNGTYVAPYVRTPANNTVTDNLSYRGFGTIRVPRYSFGR